MRWITKHTSSLWVSLCLIAIGLSAHAQSTEIFKDGFEVDARAQAARFLDQASFGGTPTEIQRLVLIGNAAWLDEQFDAPASLQKPYLDWLRTNNENVYQQQRQEAWFIHSAQLADPSNPLLTHNDQLRQRVAFALSELLVVSDKNAALLFQPWALADYYDTLARNSFGNYRTLLKEVTLHPAMGRFLSMLGNRKTDTALNIRPDENYAREIMQLFSIGLVQLNLDGSPILQSGQPIPTYGQNQVRGFAHVFTGWNFSGCTQASYSDCEPGNPYEQPWTTPMAAVEAFHDTSTNKQLLIYPSAQPTGGLLIAGGNAQQEMDIAIDNIFNHPNVGPFVAKHLILRLITSNPTPAYVARIAAVFNNNGQGVRGDLKAVVRAILLDTEARTGPMSSSTFGKLREPITKLVKLWRLTNARSGNGRVFRYSHIRDEFAQFPLSAPSVFNFFKPNFAQPGEIRNAGLVSPEFQIATDTTLVSAPNQLGWRIMLFYMGSRYSVVYENGVPVPEETLMDYSALKLLAATPAALIEHLNLHLMSGQMSGSMKSLLINRLNGQVPDAVPGQAPGAPDVLLWRVQQALYLIVNSPEFNIQK
jgi:uncharacterized protein (DUF1800 family)